MKLFWVTNIPTPYRNHRYNTMQEIFPEYGIDFEVQYMSWTSPGRFWKIDTNDMKHPYRMHRGLLYKARRFPFRINPSLYWHVRRARPDIVVIGGYASPSHWLSTLSAHPDSIRLLSVESNLESNNRDYNLAMRFKRWLTEKHEGYVITGPRSRKLLEHISPEVSDRPFVTLPNLIDKNLYGDEVQRRRENRKELRARLKVDEATQLWMCPARLETFKGLQLLIPQMEGLENIKLLVAGTGSQREYLEDLAKKHEVPVEFLGQQNEDQMLDLYAAADLFVLPSWSDPSPLSPIEACAAGLPLLVSTRIGNFDDVLEPGVNGWAFDADNPPASRPALEEIAGLARDELQETGEKSKARYQEIFDSDRCVHLLAEQLISTRENILSSRASR